MEVLVARPPSGVALRDTPLVFLHGAFTAAWCWAEHFMPWFAERGFTSYAISFRGHGGSAGHDRLHGFGINDYVRDVASLIEDLPGRPVIIGHSMGGFVGMRYLETAGEAEGLVLLASVPPTGLSAPALSIALWNPALWRDLALMQGFDPKWASPDTIRRAMFAELQDPGLIQAYFARMGNESRQATLDMHGMVRLDTAKWKGRQPVLVLGAAEDTLIRRAYVRSTGRVLGRPVDILPGLGHGMMLDQGWERCARRIADWLEAQGL